MPVDKQVESVGEESPLAERASMVHKGTAVTRGSGEGVVVASGMDTELGHISSLVEEAEEELTPLEKRLDQLGRRLVWIALVIAAVVAGAGILAGREILLMIETAIALAVATVPEGLPIVATIALARGMQRMARRNALINRLSAVEAVGATNVICTDKTGTLTENQMTVVEIALAESEIQVSGEGLDTEGRFSRNGDSLHPADHEALYRLLQAGVLCNNAELHKNGNDGEREAIGDPLEVALLVAGVKAGIYRDDLLSKRREVREVAFDPDTKMMATFHEKGNGYAIAVKGAPGPVLSASSQIRTGDTTKALDEADRKAWLHRNRQMAEEGLRIVALAASSADTGDAQPYEHLTIAVYQNTGQVVAMTGDGVNDAPALKKADIGVAMGRRGTQVAKEAADMVLQDDSFASIVAAVEQGRVIFDNIRKFVLYLLSCNISEIAVISLASLANAPLPIRPLQILFLNLVTDIFPALALGVGEGEERIMRRPPRDPNEPILTRRSWIEMAGFSALITMAVLGALALAYLGLGMQQGRAVKISFLTLAFAQLWHVFNMRDQGSSFLDNKVVRNRWLGGPLPCVLLFCWQRCMCRA